MFIAYASTASAVASASLVDRLIESLVIMVIGMSAVFLMLTISMFGMMLIGKIASPKEEKSVEAVKESAPVENVPSQTPDDDADIAAVVAVIHHLRRKSVVDIPLINRKDI